MLILSIATERNGLGRNPKNATGIDQRRRHSWISSGSGMVVGPEQSYWPGTLVTRIVGMTWELKWLLIDKYN
jgi:hypothetical protein